MAKAPWEVAKAAGNESYQAGRFEDAIAQWSNALDLVSDDQPNSSSTMAPEPIANDASSDNSDAAAAELARAALSGDAATVKRLLTPQQNVSTSSSTPVSPAQATRAMLLGNRAQAKAQLRDPEGASADAAKACELDPSNAKAAVRLALAFEELGKLRAAQAAVTRALSLPLTPALSKAASACSRRVEAASQADASVLAASSNSGNTLVNEDQSLRLHFASTVPPRVIVTAAAAESSFEGLNEGEDWVSSEPFEVVVHLANEFGLWRPRDWNGVAPPASNSSSAETAFDTTTAATDATAAAPAATTNADSSAEPMGLLPLEVKLRPHNAAAKKTANAQHVKLRVVQTSGAEAVDDSGNAMATTDAPFSVGPAAIATQAAAAAAASSLAKPGAPNLPRSSGSVQNAKPGSAVVWLGPSGKLSFTVQLFLRRQQKQLQTNATSEGPSWVDPSVFLEVTPWAYGMRPAMPVLSMPIQVSFGAGDELASGSNKGEEAVAIAAAAAEVAAFEKLSLKVGAHSCRVYACGDGQEVIVAESPGHLGIGGKVWDAALVLLRYLRSSEGSHLVAGKRIAELGAGTGVVGLACALGLGARDVVITDLEEVTALVGLNALLNDLHDAPVVQPPPSSSAVTVAAVPLGWAHPPPLPFAPRLELGPNYSSTRSNDEGNPTCTAAPAAICSGGEFASPPRDSAAGPLDTLLLADVIYDPDLYLPLVSTLQALVPYVGPRQDVSAAAAATASSDNGSGATSTPTRDSCAVASPPPPPPPPAVVLAYRHRNPEDYRFWAALHAAGFDSTEVVDTAAAAAAAAAGGAGATAASRSCSDGTPSDVVVYRVVRARPGTADLAAVAAIAEKPPGPPGPPR